MAGLTAAAEAAANCEEIFGGTYQPASNEPLASCQWDMSLIHANAQARARATGDSVGGGQKCKKARAAAT